MEQRNERMLIETPRHRIAGTITLASEGYRSRVSDLLNAPERDFISLTDATVTELGGDREVTQHEFIAVHRGHVVFAVPLGEVAAPADGAIV